jgi:hypothetical protein
MEEETIGLDEIVAVGYGTQKNAVTSQAQLHQLGQGTSGNGAKSKYCAGNSRCYSRRNDSDNICRCCPK